MPKQKRLTDKEKAEVITDYASGKGKTEIAQKFKLSVTAISKIPAFLSSDIISDHISLCRFMYSSFLPGFNFAFQAYFSINISKISLILVF